MHTGGEQASSRGRFDPMPVGEHTYSFIRSRQPFPTRTALRHPMGHTLQLYQIDRNLLRTCCMVYYLKDRGRPPVSTIPFFAINVYTNVNSVSIAAACTHTPHNKTYLINLQIKLWLAGCEHKSCGHINRLCGGVGWVGRNHEGGCIPMRNYVYSLVMTGL